MWTSGQKVRQTLTTADDIGIFKEKDGFAQAKTKNQINGKRGKE